MKKRNLPMALLASIALAGGGVIAPQQITAKTTIQANNEKQTPQKDVVKQRLVVNDYGGLDYNPLYQTSSRSPKEYGQWLQASGRQKWSKSKKRK